MSTRHAPVRLSYQPVWGQVGNIWFPLTRRCGVVRHEIKLKMAFETRFPPHFRHAGAAPPPPRRGDAVATDGSRKPVRQSPRGPPTTTSGTRRRRERRARARTTAASRIVVRTLGGGVAAARGGGGGALTGWGGADKALGMETARPEAGAEARARAARDPLRRRLP